MNKFKIIYYVKKYEVGGGINLLMDIRSNNNKHFILTEQFESRQIKYFSSLINKYSCTRFIDIGANIGLYSLIIPKYTNINHKDIIAFEPEKRNLYQFYTNLFINELEDYVDVRNYGLSSQNAKVAFSKGINVV